jgi:hypothetical protein
VAETSELRSAAGSATVVFFMDMLSKPLDCLNDLVEGFAKNVYQSILVLPLLHLSGIQKYRPLYCLWIKTNLLELSMKSK